MSFMIFMVNKLAGRIALRYRTRRESSNRQNPASLYSNNNVGVCCCQLITGPITSAQAHRTDIRPPRPRRDRHTSCENIIFYPKDKTNPKGVVYRQEHIKARISLGARASRPHKVPKGLKYNSRGIHPPENEPTNISLEGAT